MFYSLFGCSNGRIYCFINIQSNYTVQLRIFLNFEILKRLYKIDDTRGLKLLKILKIIFFRLLKCLFSILFKSRFEIKQCVFRKVQQNVFFKPFESFFYPLNKKLIVILKIQLI